MMDAGAATYPHELAEALWTGIWFFGSAIGLMAVAFSSLAWWSLKRSDRQAQKCEENAAKMAQEFRERNEESEARILEQVRANHEASLAYAQSNAKVAEALKNLRREVIGAQDTDTPEPQPIISHLHQRALRLRYKG